MVRDIVDVVRGIFVIGVLIWVGWVIAGAFGWQETIVEILKVMGILIGVGISAWIVYEIYDWRQTQKKAREMQEKGFVQHEGEWMTPEKKEAREKISEFDCIRQATEDPRVADMKDEAITAIEEKKFQRVHELLGEAKKVAEKKVYRVAREIKEFRSAKEYNKEEPYKMELLGWLRRKFPSATIEETRGSARPDIIIDDIAIEVKGPTGTDELRSIADKALRYLEHYEDLIIVLFDIRASEDYLEDWKKGMKREHPNVKIIKK